jgi:hypothetical protein
MVNEMSTEIKFLIDRSRLPNLFPTHCHPAEFWEQLGRTVACFGFLEEILARAIFAFTSTRKYPPDEAEKAFNEWSEKLEKVITDPLNGRVRAYEQAVKEGDFSEVERNNAQIIIEAIKKASKIRNVLCHGSWRPPDESGKALPFFFEKERGQVDSGVDLEFLRQTQKHVVELICAVMDSVTSRGLQFPGSQGPGHPIG